MIQYIIFSFLCASCLTSCGFKKKVFGSNPDVVSIKTDVRLAGRVERVDEEAGYVLIRRYGPWRFDSNEEIAESRSEGRAANLLPTGERLGEHVAADIRSGDVQVGDAVYIRKVKVAQDRKSLTEPGEAEQGNNLPTSGENS